MRVIVLSPKVVGKRVAKTIRDAAGRPLVIAGTVLTVQLVQSLLRRGFASVYVQNELLPELEITESGARHKPVEAVIA